MGQSTSSHVLKHSQLVQAKQTNKINRQLTDRRTDVLTKNKQTNKQTDKQT